MTTKSRHSLLTRVLLAVTLVWSMAVAGVAPAQEGQQVTCGPGAFSYAGQVVCGDAYGMVARADFAAGDPFPSSALTHTRAGHATTFDSTGTMTYAPNNLLLQSNTFSNAAWTKTAVSIGGTTPGPNGLTGTLIVPSAISTAHLVSQSVTTSSNAIIWAIAKSDGTYNALSVASGPNNYVHFNLTNGDSPNLPDLIKAWRAFGITVYESLPVGPPDANGRPTRCWTSDGGATCGPAYLDLIGVIA